MKQSKINKHTSPNCTTSLSKMTPPLLGQRNGNVIIPLKDTEQGVCQLSMLIIQYDTKQATGELSRTAAVLIG